MTIIMTIVYELLIWRSDTVFIHFCLIINSFRYAFRFSENEFLETLTILKPNPKTARKLHKAMMKELYNGMNDDLEDVLKEGSLYEILTKIAKLSEESTTSANEHAWSVVDIKRIILWLLNVVSYLRVSLWLQASTRGCDLASEIAGRAQD